MPQYSTTFLLFSLPLFTVFFNFVSVETPFLPSPRNLSTPFFSKAFPAKFLIIPKEPTNHISFLCLFPFLLLSPETMAVSGSNSTEIHPVDESSSSSSTTSLSNLKIYAAIGVIVACVIAACALIFLCFRRNRDSRKHKMRVKHSSGLIPLVSKEIAEIKESDRTADCEKGEVVRVEKKMEIEFESGVGKKSQESDVSGGGRSDVSVEDQNLGWGRWYSLKELEMATDGFLEENVIGEGGYGIVYRGVSPDGSVVAVKSLLNNKGQAEKEFKVEVEAIGKVRHKNLVGLIGFCAEGAQRMLVFEYIDNGNLEQWLHGDVGPVSPLTWDIRMKIALGTAKGLAYLHEGLEPKVVHRDVKSSNILLDRKWNAKVSDFGLAKLLQPEATYVTTRVMGTFGYVSPEYASTGMLNEGSDVYSFGVLLMEIITGRSPIDYSRPPGEMNLVDWFKGMVANRRGEEVVDPLIEIPPSPRALKRLLLVCLRCIDLDANKRPKMGQIVHMLEADDFPYRSELRSVRDKDSQPSRLDVPSKLPSKHAGIDDTESRKR